MMQTLEDQLISDKSKTIALVGNPNVGKSTIFNALTGLNQHTGNWPGKTVTNAQGKHQHQGITYQLIDLPGTYSLMAHSVEEEVARDFICFGGADALIVICDATCLERNLNIVLQALEITSQVVLCVNLLDEAQKKKIHLDLLALSQLLGVPVIGTKARSNQGLSQLMDAVANITQTPQTPLTIHYDQPLEDAIQLLQPALENALSQKLNSRWIALKLLDNDPQLTQTINQHLGIDLLADQQIKSALNQANQLLTGANLKKEDINDQIVSRLITVAQQICDTTVTFENAHPHATDRQLDKWLTSKSTGIPIMLALLSLIFWLTITGANLPSQLLSNLLFGFQDQLTLFFLWLGTPPWVHEVLVLGMYHVVAWVIAVMLPPMAIFFPLFTLLEDFGYLPRVAFNLDHHFKKACTCGKQSLTMCMELTNM